MQKARSRKRISGEVQGGCRVEPSGNYPAAAVQHIVAIVVAFHKDTGQELWRALDAREIAYAPPVIYTVGGRRQLII